ncbi:Os06g0526350 [Oryza sativa Japonica Group]|uniref:Os06g0526350 protein n=1 Tax=Oryza sativa subsp. japonica TaxID=39947 RepID=A0A0P0WXL3_ORYSJ|nr:hypothetical protein EE612_034584 [Oryza sativa]KAF2927039.1 hypothetical protein DAI22_06g172603 [Oryza sativa Japonica Group]BAS98037.1 Os06g0526350 [Oryza sativa Japonica Group]
MQQRRSTVRWLEQRRMHSPAHCIDDNGSPSCGDLTCILLFHSPVFPFLLCYSVKIKPWSCLHRRTISLAVVPPRDSSLHATASCP